MFSWTQFLYVKPCSPNPLLSTSSTPPKLPPIDKGPLGFHERRDFDAFGYDWPYDTTYTSGFVDRGAVVVVSTEEATETKSVAGQVTKGSGHVAVGDLGATDDEANGGGVEGG
jgi:hypothetical protein